MTGQHLCTQSFVAVGQPPARARNKGCTLLVTDGDWQGAPTRLQARVCGYEITAGSRGTPVCGFGRISRVRLRVSGVCAGRRVIGRARAG